MHVVLIIFLGILLAVDQATSFAIPNSAQVGSHVQTIPSRKQFNNFKRFEVRKRADEDETKGKPIEKENKVEGFDNDVMSNVKSVVIAIDTGSPTAETKNVKGDAIDKIELALKDLMKPYNVNNPLMRARDEYNIKPELIKFRSGKPSMKFEINSHSIIKAFHSLLNSPAVRRYAEDVAQKAAAFFKVINEEVKIHKAGD